MHKNNIDFQKELGVAEQHKAAGKLKEADATLRQILVASPDFHPAYHALGLVNFEAGNLPQAVALISQAIARDAKVALYHRDSGEMCRRLGRLDEAVAAGQRACALTPNDLDAHYNLGLAHTDRAEWAEAIAAYQYALKLCPSHGMSWNNLGAALEKQGKLNEAETAYAQAVAINPAHSEAQNNLGAIYSTQGRLNEACLCFEAAIAAAPDFIEAHFNLSSLKTYRENDPHLLYLERNLGRAAAMPDQARIRYWFALGKAREDVGRFDESFVAYAAGNRLQHALLPGNEARDDALLVQVQAVFTRDFFTACQTALKSVQRSNRAPVFIVGMPRSGTSLLEQILSSHPAVHGAGELLDLNAVIMSAAENSAQHFPDFVPALTPQALAQLGDAYVERVWQLAPDAQRITDKMPANFFYIGMIHLMLPHAKIIHSMRDPMDSCFSNYARLFTDTMEFTYDLGTLGRYYTRYMKLMRHWHAVLPRGSILDLRYEDLVADTEGQARRILDFVGLPWDDNCLAFHKNPRHVKTASVAQVRKPIYTTSVARWQRFTRHLMPLFDIVKDDRDPGAAVPPKQIHNEYVQNQARLTQSSTQPPDPHLATEHLLARANQYLSEGNLAQAEHEPRQILQAHPHHAFALHLLGVVAYQAGKPELAIELIQAAITRNGQVALFHANLGEMLRQQGRLDDAVRHGERAVALDVNMASAHSNLGLAHFDRKAYDLASECQHRALEINPGYAQALNNLGSIQRVNKHPLAAMDWYRRAHLANPSYLEPLSNLGAVLQEEDRTDEAIVPLEQALRINPNYAEALCNLGSVRNSLQQFDAAYPLLQRALQLRPDYVEALIGLARAFCGQDNLAEAERCARRCAELASGKADILSQLGNIYTEISLGNEAESMYRRALSVDPTCTDAMLGWGNLTMEHGELERAEALYQQALEIDSNNIPARFHLAQVKRVKAGDANFRALEAAALAAREAETPLPEKKATALHFALGKCYDDSGDYAKAFPHFLQGCRLKRATLAYDASKSTQHFESVMRVFDETTLTRLRGAGVASQVPIFVLGMPRSGTTLTEQILASHPAVFGAGELPNLLSIANRSVSDVCYPNNILSMDHNLLSAWGADYVAGLRKRAPDARHITDKMPANFYAVGLIHLMLPNAKIIHVNRNPVDTCLSCFTRLFNRKQEPTYDLAELGRYYVDYTRLMAHWRRVLPAGTMLEMQYEDLVADQEAQARRMLNYCGLEWDTACLDFHTHKRAVRTASLTQVRQPIYSTSVERWRPYEPFLGPLLDALGDLVPR